MNNWYVITGGPSTGKSTLVAELNRRGYATIPEAARTVIDRGIAAGKTIGEIRADEKEFQEIVLDHKVKIEEEHPADRLTFFDRGMHDTLAYLELRSYKIEEYVNRAVQAAAYKRVFILDPLGRYVRDYARTETESEFLKLNELLFSAFLRHGMEPLRVPAMPLNKRADFVLRHVT